MKLYKVVVRGVLEMPVQAENEAEAEQLAKLKLKEESPLQKIQVLQTHEYYNCKCSACLLMNGLNLL